MTMIPEGKYWELLKKVRDWHDKLEKGLEHSSTHLFKELIEVYKDMENYLQ
jgi:hypothetical protein